MSRAKKGTKAGVFIKLVEHVAAVHGLTQAQARAIIDTTLDAIAVETVTRDRFAVPEFGVFSRRTRKARVIRNPKTKELETLPATASIGFRMSKPGRFERRLAHAYWSTEPRT